jgi:hypothetical protein
MAASDATAASSETERCYAPECIEAVIGVCRGDNQPCGNLYCAIHSFEPFCAACAEQLVIDAAIDRTMQDYFQAAARVNQQRNSNNCGCLFISAPTLLLLGWLYDYLDQVEMPTLTIFVGATMVLIGISLLIGLIQMAVQGFAQSATEPDMYQEAIDKPGFLEFYDEYRFLRDNSTRPDRMPHLLRAHFISGPAAAAVEERLELLDIETVIRRAAMR